MSAVNPLAGHDVESIECACGASCYRPCEECDVEQYRGAARVDLPAFPNDAGCWQCAGGLVEIAHAVAARPRPERDFALVVVHRVT